MTIGTSIWGLPVWLAVACRRVVSRRMPARGRVVGGFVVVVIAVVVDVVMAAVVVASRIEPGSVASIAALGRRRVRVERPARAVLDVRERRMVGVGGQPARRRAARRSGCGAASSG